MKKLLGFIILLITIFTINNANAGTQEGFNNWLKQFKAIAISKGISSATVNDALSNISYNHKIIELDRAQPEFKINFQQYKAKVINQARLQKAKRLLKENYTLLDKVEKQIGVPKRFIVALWAVESNFGEVQGGFYIPSALASLAYDGRRQDFFKNELLYALKILDEKHISKQNFKGSWAGAMGQCQFMPSSFFSYAYDFDRDGKKNIWQNKADVFASIANYLKNVGWDYRQNWGVRVVVPRSSYWLVNDKFYRPTTFFIKNRVHSISGFNLPFTYEKARLVAPDEDAKNRGEIYLVYENYEVFMHWNRSSYFATSIGLIADELR